MDVFVLSHVYGCERDFVEKSRLKTEATWESILGLTSPARAPVKAIEQSGESPDWGIRYRPIVEGNCVFNRKGGEQP